MYLRQRTLTVEPVKRLRDRDRIGASGLERHRFRCALVNLRTRSGPHEEVSHSGNRFHGHHASARPHEQPRQLAGARCEVDHDGAATEPQRTSHPVERRGRIVGTAALVRVGSAVETGCGGSMDHRATSYRGDSGELLASWT
jgi:hypothetical protein